MDREAKNPFDIEHIWADSYPSQNGTFDTVQDFQEWRDHVGSLLLLPADVNRSLQDKPFPEKVGRYEMLPVSRTPNLTDITDMPGPSVHLGSTMTRVPGGYQHMGASDRAGGT